MEVYDIMVNLITWALRVAGGAMVLFGVVKLFQSFGENGTGQDRVTGVLSSLGGIGVFVLSVAVGSIFPEPPRFDSSSAFFLTLPFV